MNHWMKPLKNGLMMKAVMRHQKTPNRQSIIDEINELKSFKDLAENIRNNSKVRLCSKH